MLCHSHGKKVVYNCIVIYTPDTLSLSAPHKKRVLVGGCFDILHLGHITFLEAARKKGDSLFVALESDEFMKRKKKKTPIHTQQERAFILDSLRMVDGVILLPLYHSFEDYLALVKKVAPSVIAVTDHDPQLENKKRQAKEVGATVFVVTPLLTRFSSSSIREYAAISGDRFTD